MDAQRVGTGRAAVMSLSLLMESSVRRGSRGGSTAVDENAIRTSFLPL